jgi:hypothetical protein
MEHEEGIDMARDKFFRKGLRIMEREKYNEQEEMERQNEGMVDMEGNGVSEDEEIELLKGRIKREELKRALWEYMDEGM